MAKTPQVCAPPNREDDLIDSSPCSETAVPYKAFKKAGFEVHFATENGRAPEGDKRMLEGITQKLLVLNDPPLRLRLPPWEVTHFYHFRELRRTP